MKFCAAGSEEFFATDGYDHQDSFIDDSDIMQNLETQEKSQKQKTKHQGFFVNTGDLDIHEDISKTPKILKQRKEEPKKRKRTDNSQSKWKATHDTVKQGIEKLKLFTWPSEQEKNGTLKLSSFAEFDRALINLEASIFELEPTNFKKEDLIEIVMNCFSIDRDTAKNHVLRAQLGERIIKEKKDYDNYIVLLRNKILSKIDEIKPLKSDSLEDFDKIWSKDILESLVDLVHHVEVSVETENKHKEYLEYCGLQSQFKKNIDLKGGSETMKSNITKERNDLYREIAKFFPVGSSIDFKYIRKIYHDNKKEFKKPKKVVIKVSPNKTVLNEVYSSNAAQIQGSTLAQTIPIKSSSNKIDETDALIQKKSGGTSLKKRKLSDDNDEEKSDSNQTEKTILNKKTKVSKPSENEPIEIKDSGDVITESNICTNATNNKPVITNIEDVSHNDEKVNNHIDLPIKGTVYDFVEVFSLSDFRKIESNRSSEDFKVK